LEAPRRQEALQLASAFAGRILESYGAFILLYKSGPHYG
jgi:hypothetical protein